MDLANDEFINFLTYASMHKLGYLFVISEVNSKLLWISQIHEWFGCMDRLNNHNKVAFLLKHCIVWDILKVKHPI